MISDKVLAQLYGVTTGNLNKAVSRNLDRFPEEFMFRLTADELKDLIFHFGTSSWGGTRKRTRVFILCLTTGLLPDTIVVQL